MEPDELDIGDLEEAEMELLNSWELVDSDYSWQEDAACKGMGNHIFFLDQGEAQQKWKMARIKKICGSCPVQQRCLEWAVDNMIPAGFWGGVAPRARQAMRRRGDV